MIWSPEVSAWCHPSVKGTKWSRVRKPDVIENIKAKYRTLMSRAREVLLIWVPPGDDGDATRLKARMDQTALLLRQRGVKGLKEMLGSLHRKAG